MRLAIDGGYFVGEIGHGSDWGWKCIIWCRELDKEKDMYKNWQFIHYQLNHV